MPELSRKEKEQIFLMGDTIRKICIFILAVCLGFMIFAWMSKQEITEVKCTDNNKIYTGIEQIPKFEVYSNEKQISMRKDYSKQGDWLATECGEYKAYFTGINDYRGTKTVIWVIRQGDAIVNRIVYKNDKTTAHITTPYLNGYIRIEIIDSDGKTINTEQIDGIKRKGTDLKVTLPGKLKSGTYNIKVTSVSFSGYRNKQIETEYGKSVSVSDEFIVR